MSLHHSQQTDLDHLLPEGITDYCRFDRFDFQIELSSTSAEGRWPTVNVWIDGKLAHSSKVIKQHLYTYSEILDMSLDAKVLEIEYAGKTNEDTTTDADGEILENQSLTINQLIVNGIDLNLIYFLIPKYFLLFLEILQLKHIYF
jgi:hypothetical protein